MTGNKPDTSTEFGGWLLVFWIYSWIATIFNTAAVLIAAVANILGMYMGGWMDILALFAEAAPVVWLSVGIIRRIKVRSPTALQGIQDRLKLLMVVAISMTFLNYLNLVYWGAPFSFAAIKKEMHSPVIDIVLWLAYFKYSTYAKTFYGEVQPPSDTKEPDSIFSRWKIAGAHWLILFMLSARVMAFVIPLMGHGPIFISP